MSSVKEFLLVWLIHVLGWFVFSAAGAVLRGQWKAVAIRYCVPMGLASTVLQFLLTYYLQGR